MRRLTRCLPLLLCAYSCCVLQAFADNPPGVGIALSGGGAKGLAHIGVLKVLEEEGIAVSYVSGTSMGSIVGGLYAMGNTAAQVESIALALDWNEMFKDAPARRLLSMDQKSWEERYFTSFAVRNGSLSLPSGVITGQKIGLQLAEVTLPAHSVRDFTMLPRPFVCIATDLVTGKAVVLDHGDLGDAIRASMSIPTVFAPRTIDSTLLVDGGLVRNFPVQDVRALGASFVIGVDVGDPPVPREKLTTLPEILNQTMNLAMAPSSERQRRMADFVVVPDITGITTLDFESVPDIIARGEAAARACLPALRKIADSLGLRPVQPVAPLRYPESIDVEGIDVEGQTPLGRQTVLRILPFKVPGTLTSAQLRDAAERIYSTGLFKTVDFRILLSDNRYRVVLRLEGQEAASLRLGVRYDSDANASLLAGYRVWNVGREMAYVNAELQVGERYEADLRYVLPLGVFSSAGIMAQLTGRKEPFDVYLEGERVANANLWTGGGALRLGTLFSRSLLIAGGVLAEYAKLKQEISLIPFEAEYWTYALEGIVGTDSRDRTIYPRQGFSGFAVAELGSRDFETTGSFFRWFGTMNAAVSFGNRLAIVGSAFLGSTEIHAPPLHYNFTLGGVRRPAAMPYRTISRVTFVGYSPYEMFGRQAQMIGLTADYYLTTSVVLSLTGNVGGVFPEGGVSFSGNHYNVGISATIGYLSIIGPVQFSLETSKDHRVTGYLSLGYDF